MASSTGPAAGLGRRGRTRWVVLMVVALVAALFAVLVLSVGVFVGRAVVGGRAQTALSEVEAESYLEGQLLH
ncbi:MAG: hypothetical protein ACYDH5_08990 [Acidimicrobiales bacterium]